MIDTVKIQQRYEPVGNKVHAQIAFVYNDRTETHDYGLLTKSQFRAFKKGWKEGKKAIEAEGLSI